MPSVANRIALTMVPIKAAMWLEDIRLHCELVAHVLTHQFDTTAKTPIAILRLKPRGKNGHKTWCRHLNQLPHKRARQDDHSLSSQLVYPHLALTNAEST
ncbi:Uncharacterised protein [Escherichia coli]|uniref:Uncharacterized protein n=1 Tax=Escherichia coli TaxID=562 RepID=A0A376WAA4_ECOLX|nr:Uncharacterised protein [Escherichia coli]